MSSSQKIGGMAGAWLLLLVVYTAVSLSLPRGNHSLTTFGDLVQCIVPLVANAGLLANAGTPVWRRNAFWMLLALGCTLWMIGQFEWTYYEVYLGKPLPSLNPGDVVFFLRGIPMMAALALRPASQTGRSAPALRVSGFCSVIYLVDILVRLRSAAVDVRRSFPGNVQLHLQRSDQHPEHGGGRLAGGFVAALGTAPGKPFTPICLEARLCTCCPPWRSTSPVIPAFITPAVCMTFRWCLPSCGSRWQA